jgi:hypothetical protein
MPNNYLVENSLLNDGMNPNGTAVSYFESGCDIRIRCCRMPNNYLVENSLLNDGMNPNGTAVSYFESGCDLEFLSHQKQCRFCFSDDRR